MELSNNLDKKPNKDILLISLLENYCSNPTTFNILCSELVQQGIISNNIVKTSSKIRKSYMKALDNVLVKLGDGNMVTKYYYNKTFTSIKRLGVGGFGSVYEAIHKIDKIHYAIKIVKLDSYEPELFREVYYLARLNHPGVVRYYNTWIEYENKSTDIIKKSSKNMQIPSIYIQMELCDLTLRNYITNRTSIDLKKINNIFIQIVDALEYIHDNNIIHRDLKPENIFLKNNIVKIGDFGLARHYKTDIIISESDNSIVPISSDKLLTFGIGTSIYASPEQLQDYKYSFSTDIYSLGIIYYELLSNFTTNMERILTLNDLRKLNISDAFLTEFPYESKLILNLIDSEPAKRPTISQIKKLIKN